MGVLLIGGAGLALAASRRPSAAQQAPEGGAAPAATGGRLWTVDGAILNGPMTAFMDELAAAVPGVPLTVTSGYRSPSSQAAALKYKRDHGDDLHKLYAQDDLVDELLAVPSDGMALVIADQVKRGRYLSRHLRGDALDLRSKTLSQAQIDAVKAAAVRLGAKALQEGIPPHIHLERIG